MFGNLRNKMPSFEEAADVAKDSVMRAANRTAMSAREMGGQIEEWAQDGYDAVRERPILWGAASLGVGALMGGLYALWQRETKRGTRTNGKIVAARSRKRSVRAASTLNGKGRKKRRTRKPTAERAPASAE